MSTKTHHHPSLPAIDQEKIDPTKDVVAEKNSSVLLLSILAPVIPIEDTTKSATQIDDSVVTTTTTTAATKTISLSSIKKYDDDGNNDENDGGNDGNDGNDSNDNDCHCHSANVPAKILQHGRSSEEDSEAERFHQPPPSDKKQWNNDSICTNFVIKQQDSTGSSDIPSDDGSPLTPPHKYFTPIIERKSASPLIDLCQDNIHITTNNISFSTYHHNKNAQPIQPQQHQTVLPYHKLNDISRGILAKDLSLLINSVPVSSGKPSIQHNSNNKSLRDSFILQSILLRNTKTTEICSSNGSMHSFIQNNRSQDHLQQSNDFLSLSLSPPLSRRRNMPALRGPFVSL